MHGTKESPTNFFVAATDTKRKIFPLVLGTNIQPCMACLYIQCSPFSEPVSWIHKVSVPSIVCIDLLERKRRE